MVLFCKVLFVVTIANFKFCFRYAKVNFFFITRNVCHDLLLADNTLSKTSSVWRALFFICTVVEVDVWIFLLSFLQDVFVLFVYFGFDICQAAVAYFDDVTVEKFTKFITWEKVPSYKIKKIISDFCFDISSK